MKTERCFLAFFLLCNFLFSQENTFVNTIINSSLDNLMKESRLDSLVNEYEIKVVDSLPYIYNNYAYYLFDKGKSQSAIEYNYKALKIAKNDISKNKKLLQLITFDLGFYLRRTKNYAKSIKLYNEAIKYNDSSDIATVCYYDLGLSYTALKDFFNATKSYKIAIKRLHKLSYNRSLLRNVYQNLSYISYQIQSPESLKEGTNYGLAADSITQLIKTSNRTKYDIKFNLARLYGEKQYLDVNKAESYYTEAFSYASELNDDFLKAKIYEGLADLYNILETSKSIEYYHKALKLVDSTNVTLKSDLFNGLGHTYRINKEYKKSKKYRYAALEILIGDDLKDFNIQDEEKVLEDSENRDQLFHFISQLGETYLAQYTDSNTINKKLLTKSLSYFKIADKLIDKIRVNSNSFRSRLFWRKISANLYSKAIEACFLLNNKKEAFYFMEKNKSLLLLEDVYQEKYRKTPIDSVTVEESKTIFERLDSLKSAKIISLLNVQKSLNIDEVVLIYHIPTDTDYSIPENYKNGYLLCVTPKKTFFKSLVGLKNLKKQSGELFSLLKKPFSTSSDIDRYTKISFKIYGTLFPSNEIQLAIKNKKVTLVPDDYLSIIPFEALSISKKKLKYLIEFCEINYAHSNSFLNKLVDSEPNNNSFIGFAPISYRDSTLNDLPNSEYEIKILKKYFKGNYFLNEKATKNKFMEIPKKASIIHLATHSDAKGNEAPWIAFFDKKVYIDEIYNLQSSADIVVLSGCNTGYGKNEPGECIMNLARGFFYNGSKSVISSLWNIDDSSTSEIFTDFYKYLSEGKSKSEALRMSKLNYIQNNSNSEISPYYWASLVLWGDTDTYTSIDNLYWEYIVFFCILLLTFLFFFRKIRRRRL